MIVFYSAKPPVLVMRRQRWQPRQSLLPLADIPSEPINPSTSYLSFRAWPNLTRLNLTKDDSELALIALKTAMRKLIVLVGKINEKHKEVGKWFVAIIKNSTNRAKKYSPCPTDNRGHP